MDGVTESRPQPISVEGVDNAPTFFDAVGGHQTFEDLVSGFYARVAHDPILVRLYEGHDYADSARRLQMFLEQYWGGPRTYSQVRGHPRLRARHAEFHIDVAARDAWLANMRAALRKAKDFAIEHLLFGRYLQYFLKHSQDDNL